MDKEAIHDLLSQVKAGLKESAILTVDNIIEVYGDDQIRIIGKEEKGRADVFATVYSLDVTKNPDSYTFTRGS